ncbi:unnamed protein product [Adineta ricciae]|uniref:Uncharacterized protein n=2 Tax=Adineta ricciae TaxID=249248 RepID=A0A815AI89_ADIRI|nr:unnamed protein product [Adineta ricciae]
MLRYKDDWEMECFCKEITAVNIIADFDRCSIRSQKPVAAPTPAVPSSVFPAAFTPSFSSENNLLHLSTYGDEPAPFIPPTSNSVAASFGSSPRKSRKSMLRIRVWDCSTWAASAESAPFSTTQKTCMLKLMKKDGVYCEDCRVKLAQNCVVAVVGSQRKPRFMSVLCAVRNEHAQRMVCSKELDKFNIGEVNRMIKEHELSVHLVYL